ncbi:MAG: AbrB/MazE/SpoVT family DNA-binding domain-containing protein [Propionibacteriaceae bacterium]|jgi:AbrB family looped-hinge helix DNA binding protein|nr:AbrB/MazE/SpoVT family DNA-binding domain-containing protein [Propionibacteriaceae bacterium]
MTVATMTSKGQVTVPAEVRRRCGLAPGAKMDFIVMGPGRIEVVLWPKLGDLYGVAAGGPIQATGGELAEGEGAALAADGSDGAVGAALAADDARIRREYGEGPAA